MRPIFVVAFVACHDATPSSPVAIPSQPVGMFPRQHVEEPVADAGVEPDAAPAPIVSEPKQCGWVDPTTVKRAVEGCVDDQTRMPSCEDVHACSACDVLGRSYKPAVVARALDCVRRLDGCARCEVLACIDRARKGSCPDNSSTEICMKIGFKCPAVSMEECRMYLSGMNAAGRAKMLSCVSSQEGCGFGIHHCAEEL